MNPKSRRSLFLQQQLLEAIDEEIKERQINHQARVLSLQALTEAARIAGEQLPLQPLVMLAQGDSWFDYPLNGNQISVSNTDIIAQLESMGSSAPVILNMAHFGESSLNEVSLTKQQRMVASLKKASNWGITGKPDAILFSGGGNDIAGEQFCIFLDHRSNDGSGLNLKRLDKALGMVESSYLELFAFRDHNAAGVPIFSHCYDFPIPNGSAPLCAGPWLQPSLDYTGWNLPEGLVIVKEALVELKNVLSSLSSDLSNNFVLIDTHGSLNQNEWANELHPYSSGFNKIASRFLSTLQKRFPGRI